MYVLFEIYHRGMLVKQSGQTCMCTLRFVEDSSVFKHGWRQIVPCIALSLIHEICRGKWIDFLHVLLADKIRGMFVVFSTLNSCSLLHFNDNFRVHEKANEQVFKIYNLFFIECNLLTIEGWTSTTLQKLQILGKLFSLPCIYEGDYLQVFSQEFKCFTRFLCFSDYEIPIKLPLNKITWFVNKKRKNGKYHSRSPTFVCRRIYIYKKNISCPILSQSELL